MRNGEKILYISYDACLFDSVLAAQKKAMANERKKSTHFTKVDRSRWTGSCSNIDILLEIYFQTQFLIAITMYLLNYDKMSN